MSHKAWYAKGLRFECTQCGNCCTSHGEYSYVYLAEADVVAIAGHLGLARAAFLQRWCKQDEGFTILRMDAPQCPFLTEDRRCSIYPVRPKQCATWPFWEDNLDRARWEGPVKDCCPGIGKGELRPATEVERIARETEEWYSDTPEW